MESEPILQQKSKLENGSPVRVINHEGHPDDFTNWILLEEAAKDGTVIRKMQQVLDDGTITDRIEEFKGDEVNMTLDKFVSS